MFEVVNSVLGRFWVRLIDFIPDFLGGLIIFLIGIVSASILKQLLLTLLKFLKVNNILEKTKLMPKSEVEMWEEILAEVLRWTVIILFLIPTLEAWRLSRATVVLNQLFFYLPNVIVAVIIGFVGIVLANLSANLVRQSTKAAGKTTSTTLSALTRSIIVFFTVLVILNQLGVAQDLIRILFTGIVALFAIAGGLAIGLGGKDIAKEMLEKLRTKMK